jgi:hypothetical protein
VAVGVRVGVLEPVAVRLYETVCVSDDAGVLVSEEDGVGLFAGVFVGTAEDDGLTTGVGTGVSLTNTGVKKLLLFNED